jgi:FkbM family methyltransferase
MIRTGIKGFLDRHGLYYRLKYSWLFRIYQRLFKRGEIERQNKEIRFYQSFLPACKLVFDVGAYDGHKTAAFLKFTRKVVCIEPDQKSFDILLTRFRNKKARVNVERKAVTDFAGSAIIHIHHPGSAFNSLAPKWIGILESDNLRRWDEKIAFTSDENIETITLDLLIDKYGRPDFIKIDAEGSEDCILRGLSHPVPYLSFETLLPDYHEELKQCIERIESLGAAVSYNISINEKLALNQFVSKNELENYLLKENIQSSFEVIVKMST